MIYLHATGITDESSRAPRTIGLKVFFIVALIAAVVGEGYYIFIMMEKVHNQEEELRNISIRLQTLKSERANLADELSTIKRYAGEKKDGNTGTSEGQH